MPITLYIDGCSEDIAFTGVINQQLIKLNLHAMGFSIDKPCPAIFAAGRYICILENQQNQVDFKMTFYNPSIDFAKANELLSCFSTDFYKDLLLDAYNEINSETYEYRDKYIFEFYDPEKSTLKLI